MTVWNRVAIIGVCVAVFGPAVWAQSPGQNAHARTLFFEGRDFWDEGLFPEAEKKFIEALSRYPHAEQSDRTAYYLITTLIKQGRAADALSRIEEFPKRYPRSPWLTDVQEKRIALVGIPSQPRSAVSFQYFRPEVEITTRIVTGELRIQLNEIRSQIERAFSVYNFAHPFVLASDAALRHEILRVLIEKDPDYGISVAQERLKVNPSDPAVVSNLSTIAHNNSVKALSFLVHIAESAAPSAQHQAIYWLSRSTVDKQALAEALEDLLSDARRKSGASVAATALARLSAADQRKVLQQLVQSADGVTHVGRIYHSAGAAQLRAEVVSVTAQLPIRSALPLLSTAARDRDLTVRNSAIEALSQRKEPEARQVLQGLMRNLRSR